MKRIIVLSFALVALMSCGGNDSKENKEEKKEEKKESSGELSDNPDYQKGLEIIGKNDCGTCHKVDEKVTGPTFREVANKYAPASDSVINYLSDKIINGGSGVWGQVPMVPHATVSKDDAKAVVKYIMLLKK